VREFYAAYAATIQRDLPRRERAIERPRLQEVWVREHRVDISITAIRRVLFGPSYIAPAQPAEYAHRIFSMQQAVTLRDGASRTSLLRWIAEQITDIGVEPAWVREHTSSIKKAHLSFRAKFWWLIIRSWIRPTRADNVITLERAVLLASVLAGYDIDWAQVIADHLHEAAFHFSTSLPFPVMIHRLCREAGIEVDPVRERHVEATSTRDASLIKADDFPLDLPQADQVQVPELSQIHPQAPDSAPAATHTAPAPTAPVSATASQAAEPTDADPPIGGVATAIPSIASSSGAIPSQVDPLFIHLLARRVAVLETKVRSIATSVPVLVESTVSDAEARIGARIDQFESRIQRQISEAAQVDVSTFRQEVAALRADILHLLSAPALDPAAALADDPAFEWTQRHTDRRGKRPAEASTSDPPPQRRRVDEPLPADVVADSQLQARIHQDRLMQEALDRSRATDLPPPQDP
jgi:hypothetical protein